MNIKGIKILCSLVAFAVLVSFSSIEAFAGNYYFSHIGTVPRAAMNTNSESDNYHPNWEYWSQGASKYSAMRSYGCRIAAQAKMLVEMGAASPDETIFNPDIYKEWATPDYFEESISEKFPVGGGAIAYAKEQGMTVTNGYVSLSGTNSADDITLVMEYINSGYYVILHSSAHQAYVGRAASIDAGEPVILDSRSDCSYKQSLCETYRGYTLTRFTRLYYFSVLGQNPENPGEGGEIIPGPGENEGGGEDIPQPSVTVYFEKDSKWAVEETNATLAARATFPGVLNSRVNEIGIELYDSSDTLLAEKSENPGYSGMYEYGRMWYDTNEELGITLEPATDYYCVFHIVIDGEKYESEAFTFTTEGEVKPDFLLGDVNLDGIINALDSQRLYEHIVGKNPLESDIAFRAADLNVDSNINALDSQRLYEHIVGKNPLK